MSMTDPIADMLTRIRNANAVAKTTVTMPSSKVKVAIASILLKEGYISAYKIVDTNSSEIKTLDITMKYDENKASPITNIERISKPGLRVHVPADKLPRVMGGMGIAVLTTSVGVITDSEARKQHIGGEVICYVW
ncbi:MAG: 30S ribosomal protein S8 [Actinobacteria bacterium]|nr:30S ribosomal protein S8 [Actinomycetota bacterium]MCL6104680.1 30S ribosomal protein S8 [Actinomycetota bacterium]